MVGRRQRPWNRPLWAPSCGHPDDWNRPMADKAKQNIESEELAANEAGEENSSEEETPETAAGPGSESATGPEVEVARLREALLLAHAEMDNVQKRSEREIEKSRRFALERFVKDL